MHACTCLKHCSSFVLYLQECYDYAVAFQDGVKDFDRLCYLATRPTDVDEEQVMAGLRELLNVKLEKVLQTVRVV